MNCLFKINFSFIQDMCEVSSITEVFIRQGPIIYSCEDVSNVTTVREEVSVLNGEFTNIRSWNMSYI